MLAMRGLPAARCYWVGFSGGLDSTVLLSALAQQQATLPGLLHAVHVNHHLNPDSDAWQKHCQEFCNSLQIPIFCRDVSIQPVKGQSPEAVARKQRYQVYHQVVQQDDMLLLAHHMDDQMETFLLQALRGAGLRGLAGMPFVTAFNPGYVARPLLGFTRKEIRAWAELQNLTWLDDPSNLDERYDRNFLRNRVIPVINQRWPSAALTMARSAGHCSETLAILEELAEVDLSSCQTNMGQVLDGAAVHKLGPERSRNLLRHWLERLGLPLPPSHKLEQILREVVLARAGRIPCVAWEGAEVRRFRGCLYGLSPQLPAPTGEFSLRKGEQTALGGALGKISLVPSTDGERLRAADCPPEGLRLRFRTGGEICKPAGRVHHRPLKKWLQDLKIVPWMRERLPLLYVGDQLAAVAGLFVCAPFAAGNDEPGLRIDWVSHPPLH